MALTGCSQVTSTIGSDTIRIIIPSTYDSGTPAHMVMYFHGAGDDNNGPNFADTLPLFQALINAGYLITSSDAADDNWGNQAGIDAYEDLHDYAIANYNIADMACYAGSMGGMCAWLCLVQGVLDNVKGLAGIYPVCNLSAMFAGNAGLLAGQIRTAYGIAGDGSDYASLTSGHDPYLYAESSYPRFPYRFWASPGDTIVTKAANTDLMAAKLATYRPESTVITCSGEHGDVSHYQPSDIAAFYDRCFVTRGVPWRMA